MEVFMDDFTIYFESFEACLDNLSMVLHRCIESNLVLNFVKCHFMVTEGIVLGHLVSARGIEVNKAKIDAISSLPNSTSVRDVRSFLGHATRSHCLYPSCNKRTPTSSSTSLTHVRTHLPSTKLGTSIRANVRHLQLHTRSNPRSMSQQPVARNCLRILNDGCNPSQLHNHRKGAFRNSHICMASKFVKVPLEEVERKAETNIVDAASPRVRHRDQGQERREEWCSEPLNLVGERLSRYRFEMSSRMSRFYR
ncbi:Retrovirus-related Pol polyprotein from transposon opus, partial [Mucuna pruriens]